ncbi:UDP-N-acetylmuramoyl-tripeptide--D-alanyl-D-alanine ligase [Natronoflexus pectinivorans]|uniref:UDP-N-acetylmuramoyl-tripeptide--D-alanyl-D-alanine ligase n=1 Tax=Natronoflexus pectinivorans TaxID=682526 RepID=A0A4R2GML2_9BACT|nr:UDP-N-acetylmuramoyl-tripeptide--D-alanyl-D-alanine ligase [Natronoflexus pectinivorans]TCO09659.1 UDP-N-acetylmuramoyl-tripeptide--D-alanyl-D-alanine ligase [Natronoflexus pectinivorans]
MELNQIYDSYLKSGIVTTDSRTCFAGAIYFALKGERFDGNNYALEALKKGCSLAVVDDVSLKNEPHCIWVPDALKTLQQLATHHRHQTQVKVIGITGSNGKTTTKELIAEVLKTSFSTWFTQGNLNNHIGVPLTLLSMPPGTQIAVVEMGANHIGEIAQLCDIAQPDMGLITNVGKAHIEGFGSFEGVKKAKGELYNHLKTQGNEIFINGDNHHLKEMIGDYNGTIFRYGNDDNYKVTGRNVKTDPFLSFEWKSENQEWEKVSTQLTGAYNYENVLVAITIGLHFGISAKEINKAINNYQPVNHRSQIIKTEHNTVILDAYNANPSSMEAALSNFADMKGDNKILILGGMKELGKECQKEHQELVEKALKVQPKTCFLVGAEFQNTSTGAESINYFEKSEDLREHLVSNRIVNATILLKGSRANKLEELLDLL